MERLDMESAVDPEPQQLDCHYALGGVLHKNVRERRQLRNDDFRQHLRHGMEWNGTSWGASQTIPSPSGGTEIVFSADSCTSSTFCMAVGDYENSASEIVTLAEEFT
jgi:hypothetical protein